jgi:SAM-dependent methyltransferase
MDQVFAQAAESNELLANVGYPRRMLRRLIVRDGIGPGSRVLDVGCGDGALVHFFDQLGLRSTGIERLPERLAALRRDFPNLDWQPEPPRDAANDSPFDLIVVRNDAAYERSVLAPDALRLTGELLALLRPAGTLAFVFRRDVSADGSVVSHDGSCFLKHIECFPGECRTEEFPDGFSQNVLRRLVGTRRPAFVTVALGVPQEPVGRTGWLRFAEVAARSLTEVCCAWGAAQPEAAPRRSAA